MLIIFSMVTKANFVYFVRYLQNTNLMFCSVMPGCTVEILLRFWSHAVASVGDIEKAFLMISVNPKDRDVLRFP